MPSVEELLNQDSEDEYIDISPINEIITIDPETRTINLPASETLFGTEQEMNVERKYFKCPKIVGDNIDLSKHQIYITYVTAKDNTGTFLPEEEPGLYYCEDMVADGDYIKFSWLLSGNVLSNHGFIAFAVVAKHMDGDVFKTRWKTKPAVGMVLLTVPDGASQIVDEYSDIITQLLNRMDDVEVMATPEAMQGYVNTYLAEHPAEIDPELLNPKKCAPADVVGQLKDDLSNFFVSRLNFDYEVGGIDESTGVTKVNTKYIRTKDFITLESAVHIEKLSNSAITFYQYNEKDELEKKYYFGELHTSKNLDIESTKKYKIVYNHIPVEEANLEVYKTEFKLFPETSKIISLSNAPFVFPELFYSSADPDWTRALNAAIETGKDVICRGNYNISNLEINNSVNLIGGNFNARGKEYAITVNADNVKISNIVLNCSNACNGILISDATNVTINNSEIFNCKHIEYSNGVYATNSKDVYIHNSHIHNVSNDNGKPARAIQLNRSKHALISYCTIHDIDSADDADGIHIIFDGSADESNDKTIVENCDIYNCKKRCIKIQQRNTTIRNCTFLYEKNTFNCSVGTIGIYDSDCTVDGCYLNGASPIQIALLGDSSDTSVIRNTKIINNTLISSAKQTYQGLVQTVESSKRNFNGLFIINNSFLGGELLNDHGVCFRNVGIGFNIIVANNTFNSLSHAVYFRHDDRDSEIGKFIFCNNIATTNYSCILIESSAIKVKGINITGNLFSAANMYKDRRRLFGYESIDSIKPELTNVTDNTPVTETTKQIEWLNTIGDANTSLPSIAKNRYTFFDTITNTNLTYYNGNWYYPNGALRGSETASYAKEEI